MKNLDLTKSKQLYDQAIEIIPGGSQTMSKRPQSFAMGAMPIYIQRGQGCYVWDVDGNKYIDYISALGPITLGYCYPAVDEAVRRQLKDGMIFPMMHPLEVEAAKAIIDMVPCAEMVRFLKTGAEATSAAARIARGYTGKQMVLSSGYHGWLDTWGALNSGPESGVPSALKESVAGFSFGDMTSDSSLEALLEKHKGQVACIMMEAASYSTMDSGDYLRYARELADKHEAVLAFDEIVTGFRLANGGAQEYFGVIPDLACFAKGISNGMPVAAVVGKREVMKTAADLVISSTYGGDAVSLAACVACLRELRTNGVIGHLWHEGGRLIDGMNAIAREIGLSLEFRGWPVMSSYSFGCADAGVNTDLMTLLLQEMAKRGVLLRRGGLIFMTYSHKAEHVDTTLDACREVFPMLLEAYNSGALKDQLVTDEVAADIRRF